MEFFIKYIYVKGNLQHGDVGLIEFNNKLEPVLVGIEENVPIRIKPFDEDIEVTDTHNTTLRRIEIAICSSDLLTGDRCYTASSEFAGEISVVRDSMISFKNEPESFYPAKDYFKIVGRASDKAIWVRDGQVYQKSQVRFLKCSLSSGDTEPYDQESDKDYDTKKWYLLGLLKCPCCRYWF